MAGLLLALCLAFLPQGSRCLSISAPRQVNSTDESARSQRATWEFVDGWVRPDAVPGDWAPNSTEPRPVLMRAQVPQQHAGFMFITAAHKKYVREAAVVQDSWTRFLATDDNVVNVGDPDCMEDTLLRSFVALPSDVLKDRDGYERAQMKHVFGTVYVARELAKRGTATWPQWWILKDDDTYVNVHNLRAVLARYDPSKPLLIGSASGPYVNGGSGMALSWQVVEQIVLNGHDNQLLNCRADNITAGRPHWDYWMPTAIQRDFVPDMEIRDDLHFENCIENCGGDLVPYVKQKHDSKCVVVPGLCTCAKTDAPAMWHLKGFPKQFPHRVEVLEAYENRTREGDQKQ